MSSLTASPLSKKISTTAGLLFLIFIISTFILDDSKYKTLFYITLPIPALLLIKELLNYNKETLHVFISLTAVLIYFSISTLWSNEPNLIENLKYSLLILLFFILSLEYCKQVKYKTTVKILFYFTSFLALFYLASFIYTYGFNIPVQIRLNLSDILSPSENNPISSGVILGVIFLISLEMIKNSSKKELLIIILTIISTGLLLILTKSRGPLISLFIATTLTLIIKRDTKTLITVSALSFCCLLLLLTTDLYSTLMQRLEQPNYRLAIWKETLLMMENSWLFGQGIGGKAGINIGTGSLAGFTHSHSFMLEAFRTGGVFGLIIFAGFILNTTLQSIKNNNYGLFFAWLIFGMLCLSTNGRFPLMRPNIEWFCFWIPLFLWYGYSINNTNLAEHKTKHKQTTNNKQQTINKL